MRQLHAEPNLEKDEQIIRVLPLSRSPLIRAGLVGILSNCRSVEIVRRGAAPGGGLAPSAGVECDVVVVEAEGRAADALAAAERAVGAAGQGQRISIVVLADAAASDLAGLTRSAPTAVLDKTVTSHQLVSAIRMVAAGYSILTAAGTAAADGLGGGRTRRDCLRTGPADRLVGRAATGVPPHEQLSVLTEREYEVFEFLGQGFSNADISATLVLSESTIKTHVQHILNKLNLRNRVSAAILAQELGLTPSADVRAAMPVRRRNLRSV